MLYSNFLLCEPSVHSVDPFITVEQFTVLSNPSHYSYLAGDLLHIFNLDPNLP